MLLKCSLLEAFIDVIATRHDRIKMSNIYSAVFGTEIWPAEEYGRTMYTIRQRVGPLLMRVQKIYGQIKTSGELTENEIIITERTLI
ncbi:protein MET1, chloroplastic-like isoform X1 [Trifolium pratense]|uniref:protein MET1, chloroplastic-like isoform X1 n=1 Tax=Trifolium pratense TaxID=57577 RepID=UPI001E691482|nr:protein MET1, chloroplastic-like isoform X1 [Trifolium pratense]